MRDNAATYLDQGWTDAQRHKWYTTSQGSRLLPQAWLAALEQKDSTDKFLSEAHVRKLGYLPTGRPDGSPLGFVADQGPAPDNGQEPWVGMTCAACHTGEVTFGGHRLRIDGAPTLADFQTFMEELLAALVATRADGAKLDRFTQTVLGANASQGARNELRAGLDKQIASYKRAATQNATPLRYGHGRVDAQGHIMNRVALGVGAAEPLIPQPSDAPASYPFLWTTPRQEPRIQWNGIALQPIPAIGYDLGAMLRNTGEVIGVFASFDVHFVPGHLGYASSLRFENMIDLEELINGLKAPRWPKELPQIDAALAELGRKLFEDQKCGECHAVLDPATELQASINIKMKKLTVIGTDIWLACNAHLHESKSGLLEGHLSLSGLIPEVANTFDLIVDVAANMILRAQLADPTRASAADPVTVTNNAYRRSTNAGVPQVEMLAAMKSEKEERARRCRTQEDLVETLGYKAGPLNGIWATAPYLHNGAVPTLYDLLLPPSQRRTVFWVGGTELDPVDVGFKSGPGDGPFEFRVRDANGKAIPGNDNAGHIWGTGLTDPERRALIEYLKTL